MKCNYGKHGELKSNRGKAHKYLVITFYFNEKGKVKMKMDDYVKSIINDFPIKINRNDATLTPDGNNIFEKVTSIVWVKKKLKISILKYQEECLCPREQGCIFIKLLWCFQQRLKNILILTGKSWWKW